MVTVGLVLAVATPVKAALHDRGGGLIYDDVLKITWLQDARYAPATMLWSQAVAWAEGLSYYDTVRGVTWTDWRLPQVRPVDGVGFNYAWSFDGSTDMAYNISAPGSVYPGSTGSEMAYLYSVNLGNLGFYDTNGVGPQPGYSSVPNAEFTDGTSGMTVAFENLNIGALVRDGARGHCAAVRLALLVQRRGPGLEPQVDKALRMACPRRRCHP